MGHHGRNRKPNWTPCPARRHRKTRGRQARARSRWITSRKTTGRARAPHRPLRRQAMLLAARRAHRVSNGLMPARPIRKPLLRAILCRPPRQPLKQARVPRARSLRRTTRYRIEMCKSGRKPSPIRRHRRPTRVRRRCGHHSRCGPSAAGARCYSGATHSSRRHR